MANLIRELAYAGAIIAAMLGGGVIGYTYGSKTGLKTITVTNDAILSSDNESLRRERLELEKRCIVFETEKLKAETGRAYAERDQALARKELATQPYDLNLKNKISGLETELLLKDKEKDAREAEYRAEKAGLKTRIEEGKTDLAREGSVNANILTDNANLKRELDTYKKWFERSKNSGYDK